MMGENSYVLLIDMSFWLRKNTNQKELEYTNNYLC